MRLDRRPLLQENDLLRLLRLGHGFNDEEHERLQGESDWLEDRAEHGIVRLDEGKG